MVETANEYLVIQDASADAARDVSASKAYIHGVFVNVVSAAAGDKLEIYDDNSATSSGVTGLCFTIDLTKQGFHPIGCRTVNGIVVKATVASAADSNATLIYRKLA